MTRSLYALAAAMALAVVATVIIVAGRGPAVEGSGAGMTIDVFRDRDKTELICTAGPPMRDCGLLLVGEAFSIDILASAIPPEGYTRFQVVLTYSSPLFNLQQQTGFDEVVWPDEGCDLAGFGEETKDIGQYVVTCKRDGTENSSYVGPLANVQFVCKEKGFGVIEIAGGTDIDKSSYYFRPDVGGSFVFLKDADSVQVECVNSFPTATPTLTETPTPTATGTLGPTKAPGPKMSIHGFADKDKTEQTCVKGPALRKCGSVVVGDAFSIDVIASVVPPEGYSRFQAVIDYSTKFFTLQQQTGFDEVVWPDEGCDLVGFGEEIKDPGQYLITCKRAGSQNSTYAGALANIQFVCKQVGVGIITIVAGTSIDKSSYYFRPSIEGNFVFLVAPDSVQVNCLSPTPTTTPPPTNTLTPTNTPTPTITQTPTKQPSPGDTDLDGCEDVVENGPDEALGGQRNFVYFWDFYDVWTHPAGDPVGWERNKVINVFDILGVALRFGPGPELSKIEAFLFALAPPAGESGYHAGYDRGPLVGPNPWDRGPPDASINIVDDILGVAAQFGHSCE